MVIASLNVNSLLLHIDEISLLVKVLEIRILALNETKLDKNIDDSLVNIDGYTIKRHDRDRQGGVVAIYLKNTLLDKTTVREDLPNSALELICVEINPLVLLLSSFWLGTGPLTYVLTFSIRKRNAFNSFTGKTRKLFF